MKGSESKDRFPRTPVDRLLETLRFAKATPYIPRGARVLDIGIGEGAFLRHLTGHIRSGVGIDANLLRATAIDSEPYRLVLGSFPEDLNGTGIFDVITLLATVEQIPNRLRRDCYLENFRPPIIIKKRKLEA